MNCPVTTTPCEAPGMGVDALLWLLIGLGTIALLVVAWKLCGR
jgi:hypothetical protein